MTFTEQIYSFKIPTRGEALDIASLPDGSLFVVTTNPVTLHAIDQNHQKVRSIDMYEFFPLQKGNLQNMTLLRIRHSFLKCYLSFNSFAKIKNSNSANARNMVFNNA